MANERLRHIGGWLLTVALEVGAALMALKAAWLIVALLFFAGVGTLAVAYFPGWRNKTKMIALLGMIVCGAGFLGCTAFYFWPNSEKKEALLAPQDRWTWSALTDAETDALFAKLRDKPSASIRIACNRNECSALADSFDSLFKRLGWPSVIGDGGMFAIGVTGLDIGPSDKSAESLKEAIETTTVLRPSLGTPRDAGTTHPIMLTIGTKPQVMPTGPLVSPPETKAGNVMGPVTGNKGIVTQDQKGDNKQ